MQRKWIISGLVCAVLGYAGVAYWQMLHEGSSDRAPSALGQTINQCDLIASKAAASLPELYPFQRLEKAARQSHVLEMCMQDRGYRENPAWVKSAKQAASEAAKKQQISEDEAYETMRRQAMLVSQSDQALYWRK